MLGYYPSIRLQVLRKTTITSTLDDLSPGRDFNLRPPKYEAQVLISRPQRSVRRYIWRCWCGNSGESSEAWIPESVFTSPSLAILLIYCRCSYFVLSVMNIYGSVLRKVVCCHDDGTGQLLGKIALVLQQEFTFTLGDIFDVVKYQPVQWFGELCQRSHVLTHCFLLCITDFLVFIKERRMEKPHLYFCKFTYFTSCTVQSGAL
jgi:hypothetical protein